MDKEFRQLIDAGADALIELRALEADYGLSANAFVAEACANADITEDRAKELRDRIESMGGVGLQHLPGFLKGMMLAFSGGTAVPGTLTVGRYTRPPSNVNKIVGAFQRSMNTPAEMAAVPLGILEAVAVAAVMAVERAGDDWNGTVDDWDQHQQKIALARDRHARALRALRAADYMAELDADHLFLHAPEISATDWNWPTQLVEFEIRSRQAAEEALDDEIADEETAGDIVRRRVVEKPKGKPLSAKARKQKVGQRLDALAAAVSGR